MYDARIPPLALALAIIGGCYNPETPSSVNSVTAATKADEIDGSSDSSELGCESDYDCDDGQLCVLDEGACVDDETGAACDPAQQDCGAGFKCNPWASDGGSTWNASQCVPIDPDPRGVGESCSSPGSGTTGIDDCATGAACINGLCVELCSGSAAAPECGGEGTHCVSYNDDALRLCEVSCHPLEQDCTGANACYYGDGDFGCVASGTLVEGEVCEFQSACEPGLACMAASAVPCTGDFCCTPYCEVGDAEGCAEGLTCTPLFAEGTAPAGAESVGVCNL